MFRKHKKRKSVTAGKRRKHKVDVEQKTVAPRKGSDPRMFSEKPGKCPNVNQTVEVNVTVNEADSLADKIADCLFGCVRGAKNASGA